MGLRPLFFMALKRLKEGDPIPDDFWNYDLNIILGYGYRRQRVIEQEERKYNIYPIKDDSKKQ